jgi:hypothetical protein
MGMETPFVSSPRTGDRAEFSIDMPVKKEMAGLPDLFIGGSDVF